MRLWQTAIHLALAAALPLAFAGCDASNTGSTGTGGSGGTEPPAVEVTGRITPGQWEGSTAPDFTAPNLAGESVSLSDALAEGPAVVVFWATWCPSCVSKVPDLIALHKQYGQDATILGIGTKDKLGNLKSFAEKESVPYPVINDPEGRIARAYGFQGVPSMVLVAPDGVIAWQGSTNTAELKTALQHQIQAHGAESAEGNTPAHSDAESGASPEYTPEKTSD